MANVPLVPQPPPPNRIVKYYTTGGGMNMTAQGLSTMATSPNEGDATSTPFRITNLGSDSSSRTVTIPTLVSGQQYVASVTIPLPHLPGYTKNEPINGPGSTPKYPVTTRIADQLIFAASMTVQNLLPGLNILRFTAQPQARSGGQVFNGPMLPPGQQYSSFQVLCQVTFQAAQGVTGGVVTISTEGSVTRQAGGAAT